MYIFLVLWITVCYFMPLNYDNLKVQRGPLYIYQEVVFRGSD